MVNVRIQLIETVPLLGEVTSPKIDMTIKYGFSEPFTSPK